MENIKTINSENFEQEVLKAKGPVLIDVWAAWCGPCNAMNPVVEEVAKEYNVGKVNMEENMEICKEYSVAAIPTFLVFKDGEVVERKVGMQKPHELKEIMDKLQ